MNPRQAGLFLVIVGVLAAGLAVWTAPMLASVLGAVEDFSDGPAAEETEPSASPSPTPEALGSLLPRPTDSAEGPVGAVDPDTPFAPSALQEQLLALAPSISSCRAKWDEQAGPAPTEVKLQLSLAPTGLVSAALDGQEAPEAFRVCLAAVVWQTRWPAPQAPTTLRYPVGLGAERLAEEKP